MESLDPFILYETTKLQNKARKNLLFLFSDFNCCSDHLTSVFNKVFYYTRHAVLDFDGVLMKIKKKKKSKIVKTLEEGNLLFNLVVSIWFLALTIVFGGIFKLILPYKYAMIAFYSVLSVFLLNFIFKIVDVYAEYTKESLSEKIHRELLEKRSKQKP